MSPELTKQWLELARQVPECGLYDQGLQDVDPFDEGLDVGVQIRIWQEAKVNPRYFFMCILKVGPFIVDSLDKMAMGMFPGRWTEQSEESVLKPIIDQAIAQGMGKEVEIAITRTFTPKSEPATIGRQIPIVVDNGRILGGEVFCPTITIPPSLQGEDELTAAIKDMGKDQAAEMLIAIGRANPDITPWGKLPAKKSLHDHAMASYNLAMFQFAHEMYPSFERVNNAFKQIERERGMEGVVVHLVQNDNWHLKPEFTFEKLSGARGDNLPDVPELELPTTEVVVDPALKEKLDSSLLEVRGRTMGEAPPGWQRPHALLRPSDIKGFPEPEPLREIPDEPLARAKIAAEIWQGIVNDGELARTNDQVEYLFTERVRALYGNEFMRVKVDGLTATVQHLVWGTWKTL